MARKGRPSRGRRKIEIKKIENEEARHVCFSKRRIGVFTKASELSTMCGAQVAAIVYSPSGTAYSFGSPSVNSVVDSFLTQSPVSTLVDPTREDAINKLNKEYMEVCEKLAAEKQKRAMLEERVKEVAKAKEFGWLQNIDQLGVDELNQLLASLYRAKSSLNARINTLWSQGRPMAANMGLLHGRPMVPWAPPPRPSSSPAGAIVGAINFAPNPFRPGSL
ncbi:Agamous-like MADS-box protein AGL62 [Rhynchospora pubera]|uniref:Agamous-like MADS-box protein AGL62 n=1 Tax=Rhynchospora pubera TaxID=906938 RepID=A0AAV8CYQ8_9POAL|nr:Agamous-like MADS-box protein AGL62 [Rhynchospora pubera]